MTARPALAAAAALLCSTLAGCVSAGESAGEGPATPGLSPPATSASPAQPSATGSDAPTVGGTDLTDGTAPTDGSASTHAADDGAVTREITITGREVTPAPAQVPLAAGQVLRLVVTSDVANELHAHGLGDVEADLPAGRAATVELVGGEPGLYEVEPHSPQLQLLQVAVR